MGVLNSCLRTIRGWGYGMKYRAPVLVLAVLMMWASVVQAGTIDEAVSQLSYKTLDAKVTLTVQRKGEEALYKKISVQVQVGSDTQDLLMVFQAPSNMKGTGFLALTKADLDDEYYMYVRTLRRVKRVPNLSENFMLRDFLSLYFLKPRPELWRFQELGSENLDGMAMAKVEGTPRSGRAGEMAGYARVLHWVNPKTHLIMKTEFFGSDGKVVRKQRVKESIKVGKVYFPTVFETEDLVEGVSARLEVDEISLDVAFPDDWFTVRHLKTF